jgi:hypothetical protein
MRQARPALVKVDAAAVSIDEGTALAINGHSSHDAAETSGLMT